MVGIQEPGEEFTGHNSLSKEASISDVMVPCEDDDPSIQNAFTLHADTEMEHTAAEANSQARQPNMGVDKGDVKLKQQESTSPKSSQQIGDTTMDKDDADKNGIENQANMAIEEKDIQDDTGHFAGDDMPMHESAHEISIKEDDLLKEVSEALEARHLKATRPIPVLVRGKEVDLLNLCVQVRGCGGYNKVIMWPSISKSLGFGPDCGPLLKLVYVKYLKVLENRRLVASANDGAKGEDDISAIKLESVKPQPNSRGTPSIAKKKSNEEESVLDNAVVEHTSLMVTEGTDAVAGLLDWVKRLALNPGGPKRGQGSRVSRSNEAWPGKCETMAGRVRMILWNKDGHQLPLPESSPSEDQVNHRKKRGGVNPSQEKGVSAKKSRRSSG